LNHIPIKTISKNSSIFPGFFLAKSGIRFRNSFGKSQLISGFGFNDSKEAAINSSRFEAFEHLHATYDFQKETIQKNKTFNGIKLKDPNILRAFPPSSILIGLVPDAIGPSTDANGLGCHVVYEKAVHHALFETLERDCLAKLWYGLLKVVQIEDTSFSIGDFRIRFFTLESLSLPFAIAIIDNRNEGIWAVGSALRYSISSALQHAQHEAMMLIESSFIENGVSYSAEIEHRILSLRDQAISEIREVFFNSKISGYIKMSALPSMQSINFEVFEDIWVVDLCKNDELCVVKVLCPQMQNPRWHREKNLGVPYDPFC